MASNVGFAALSDDVAAVAELVRGGVVQVRAGDHGIGTGTVWSVTPDGEATVITNAHVVRAARASEFALRTTDGRALTGTLLAMDPSRDLAALRVPASGLRPLDIGDSAALRVGEVVLAVGNPFGRFGAVTMGVVAARAPADPDVDVEPAEEEDRTWPRRWRLPELEVIQADLRLYPGNSGGPMTDTRGRAVGINAMVGGGLAFAIPSRVVAQFLAEIGREEGRPRLGVQVLTVPLPETLRAAAGVAQQSGALVSAVDEDGAAAAAGVLIGDTILAVNGTTVPTAVHLVRALLRAAQGQPLVLGILRAGQRLDVSVPTVAEKAA